MKLIYRREKEVVRCRKDKLPLGRPVYEYAVLAGGSQVARGIELTPLAGGEDSIHKQVRHRVGCRMRNVAKSAVYGPHLDSLGYLLTGA